LEVDIQQGNFKILRLFYQVLILVLVEKWIPPNRSKTIEIGQKTEGILGVNKLDYKFSTFTSDENKVFKATIKSRWHNLYPWISYNCHPSSLR
jgi:hypothetical protein